MMGPLVRRPRPGRPWTRRDGELVAADARRRPWVGVPCERQAADGSRVLAPRSVSSILYVAAASMVPAWRRSWRAQSHAGESLRAKNRLRLSDFGSGLSRPQSIRLRMGACTFDTDDSPSARATSVCVTKPSESAMKSITSRQ